MEMAANRACTSLNPYAVLTDWGDGLNHTDPYNDSNCIPSPNREFIFTFLSRISEGACSISPCPE